MNEIRSAADWAPFFRARIAALGLKHLEVDQEADLAAGYTNKVINGKKLPGALTIERLCRVLKISLRPVIDGETENCALEDGDNTQQQGDTSDTQRSDLHVETRTGCGPAGAGVAGEAAGARRSGPATTCGSDQKDPPRRDPGAADAGRGMNDVMERPREIAHSPPAPRAVRVAERLQISKRTLGELEGAIPRLLLAALEGHPGAKDELAALREKIAAAQFEIENNAKARDHAAHLDQEAIAAWRASIQTLPPEEIIAGITKDGCCRRCGPAGCVIVGADPMGRECSHPVVSSEGLKARYHQNPKVLAVFEAACSKLGIRSRR
jgi:hypothetical protein